jgi:hypothetical protein
MVPSFQYYQTILNLARNDVSFDAIEQADLDVIKSVANSNTMVAYNAQSLLSNWFGYDYPLYITPPEGWTPRYGRSNTISENSLHIIPNPAKENIGINYVLDKGENARILILDVTGKTIDEINITNDVGVINLSTSKYANGIYMCKLISNGKTTLKQKFAIYK